MMTWSIGTVVEMGRNDWVLGSILKVKLTDFSNSFVVGYERKRSVKEGWSCHSLREEGCGRESLGGGGCQNLIGGCLAGYALGQGSPTPRPQTCGLLGTDHTVGGERQASEISFISIYNRAPLVTLLPEFCLLSDQGWHEVLIGALESSHRSSSSPHGKTVFQETDPRCQKDWGPLR